MCVLSLCIVGCNGNHARIQSYENITTAGCGVGRRGSLMDNKCFTYHPNIATLVIRTTYGVTFEQYNSHGWSNPTTQPGELYCHPGYLKTAQRVLSGLSNISLGAENSAKFMPLVTAVDIDRSNSIDQQQCGYWCGMYYPHFSDNTLDKLAINIPKLIRFALTYGVMLMMIIMGSVYVSDCNKAPGLSVMTIIMGSLYAVCWVVRGNTETGRLPKIVKSVKMSDHWDNDKPQSLGFSGQGLSNINLGAGNNAKFTPLVTAVDLDRSNSLDKQQSRYLSDNTLDKLAIYVPKLIRFLLTYGVQLSMIILGLLLVKGCERTPELSIMTIIMGTLYAVCWLISGKTESGKLAKIVKSWYLLCIRLFSEVVTTVIIVVRRP
ncbi:unnamed protein product [Medioppia subpectinata]|uniref:Uncharacterized protein n=1 Tax=Medioppia subpectinata TaxID=1979941 RepID=A0A7R9KGX6_9ACAR|nr:unnamed protein product [Medioppia subpectinata]CAG2103203.1 unnamed protein product [Medioppia subpectinata]